MRARKERTQAGTSRRFLQPASEKSAPSIRASRWSVSIITHRSGQAATVAGYAGPGFYTWPPGHINQNPDTNPLLHIPVPLLKNRSAPRPGSATHGYRNPNTKPPHRRPSRHCSRGRWPRFPHLALRPHHSRQWLRNRFSVSGPLPKRGSAPRPGSATHGYRRSVAHAPNQQGAP